MNIFKPLTNLSLRLKILLLSVSLLLATMVFSIGLFTYVSYKEGQTALKWFEAFSTSLGHTIGIQFSERYGDVQGFATNQALLAPDKNDLAHIFDRYTDIFPVYNVILFVDKKGNYIASNTRNAKGNSVNVQYLKDQNYYGEPWFQKSMSEAWTQDVEKGFFGTYVEPVFIDNLVKGAINNDGYGSSFSTVVRDKKNEVIGVLSCRASFSWVEDAITNQYEQLKSMGYGSVEFTILDKHGTIISEYDPTQRKTNEYTRDFNILQKLNLAEKGVVAAKLLVEGKKGALESVHARKQIVQISGYSPIDNAKFPSSIGWGTLVRLSKAEYFADMSKLQNFYYLMCGAILALFSFFVMWIAGKISASFVKVSERLKITAEETSKTSKELMDTANEVATASNEQAAAVQETVSSMAEMSSMISQTAQNIDECNEISRKVAQQTEEGNRIITKLSGAMEGIEQANTQLNSIAQLIAEVTSKTTVINDIVFKTQLLSFNASIEAARAGQHGQGFAVVAEEVGNLALMSGAAAKEIQALLQDSGKQVEHIIDINMGRVKEGKDISDEVTSAFSQISYGVSGINSKLESISHATKEQEAGIKQTNDAMGQLDMATNKNNIAAGQATQLAQTIGKQSNMIGRVMIATHYLTMGLQKAGKKKKVDTLDYIMNEKSSPEANSSSSNFVAKNGGISESDNSSLDELGGSILAMHNADSSGSKRSSNGDSLDFNADDDSFKKAS